MIEYIKTLRITKSHYGHWLITITIEGNDYSAITTNSLAINAAMDENYDDQDNSGRFYESREQAQRALTVHILASSDRAWNHWQGRDEN